MEQVSTAIDCEAECRCACGYGHSSGKKQSSWKTKKEMTGKHEVELCRNKY
jgi:hypothetical protein